MGVIALLLAAAALVKWAPERPGYDPYGWLTWGHLTLHGKLDTNGAPSWKPLPYLFTLPYALFGAKALYLWMVTAYTVSLSSLVFAGRVAYRLVRPPAGRRWAGWVAGVAAAVGILGIEVFPHAILSAESDSMITALSLAAIDCILHRRYKLAFCAWWLAALGRPEAWVPLGLYFLWAWRTVPRARIPMALGLLAIPALWFGIPALSSHSPFTAAHLAQNSPRAVKGNKFTGVASRFLALNGLPVNIAAALATVVAIVRRDRALLLVAGGVVLWVATEIAFALHGWSAVPRYIYESGAGVSVLAGVFVGRVLVDAGPALRRVTHRDSRLGWRLATALSLAVVAGFVAWSVPIASSRVQAERDDLQKAKIRLHQITLLGTAVRHLGPARILACGQPRIPIGWQSVLAWYLGSNVGQLYFTPRSERKHRHAIVNMRLRPYGWQFYPGDESGAADARRCDGLTDKT